MIVKPKKKLKKKRSAYNKHVRIDLHIHSTASDGTFSPSEILNMARDLMLGAISITDHDTIEGSRQAVFNGIPPSIKFLTGVEISAAFPSSFSRSSGSLHILGYGIKLEDLKLNQTLKLLQQSRRDRNPHIVERLKSLGFDLSLTEIMKEAGKSQIGRPHIAQVMVKKNYAKSIDEAFDKYLAKGRPAYVDKYRIPSAEAIEVILNARGLPVLAHPGLLDDEGDAVLGLVDELKKMGLKGIEVFYPEHTSVQTAYYTEIAKRFDLLLTGGTDFHGFIKPEVKMGFGKGDLFVPYGLYEKLIKHLDNLRR